jgi:nucleotide-binding universal stress UspA family protein
MPGGDPLVSREEETMSTIVVGYDSSPGAEAALRFALSEAKLRHARVRVVHAWPPIPYAAHVWAVAPDPTAVRDQVGARRSEALAELRDHVHATQAREHSTDVDVEVVGEEGLPDDVLRRSATDADLLVLGTRGHGSLANLVLGSVSQACARHAPCPVVIVPPSPIDVSRARLRPHAATVGSR